jgi:hypothetical protein
MDRNFADKELQESNGPRNPPLGEAGGVSQLDGGSGNGFEREQYGSNA